VDACPTSALLPPDGRALDARRCLSFWTIEAREPLPPELEEVAGFFGCDVCQDVCPFNSAQRSVETPLRPLERWAGVSLERIARMNDAALAELIEGTALARAGARRLRAAALRLVARARRSSEP
jgi:epoxyqueuosine reductase